MLYKPAIEMKMVEKLPVPPQFINISAEVRIVEYILSFFPDSTKQGIDITALAIALHREFKVDESK